MQVKPSVQNSAVENEPTLLERMRRRNLELDRLMRLQLEPETTIDVFIADSVRTAGRLLEVSRVSVWLFNADKSLIHCHSLYREGKDDLTFGGELEEALFPLYFKALQQARVIDAHDARTDLRTHEFLESYLEPLSIYSMLDAQIPSASGLRGVVCCESVGARREWSPDESSFLASLAELLGLAFERQEHNEMLARMSIALDEAKRANEARAAFLANMSHEIRTPLNGILGMAQALSESSLDAEQQDQASIILDSGNCLLTVVNDILDLTKIDAGKLEICPVNSDVAEAVSAVRKLFQPRADECGLRLEMHVDPQLEGVIRFDPVRVRQCLNNLLSNAIKFTSVGGIVIDAQAVSRTGDDIQIAITVRDTGIGISTDEQARLFNAFSQVDASLSRQHAGSGLGLSITRRLARLMGGDVTVESSPGQGAEFTLTFEGRQISSTPCTSENDRNNQQTLELKLDGKKVLLVDDNAVNRRIVRTVLSPFPVDVTDADGGAAALEVLSATRFDLVILDIHMPVMDGMEMFKRLRSSAGPNTNIPVIALTADAMTHDRDRYIGAGMDGYASKPIVIGDFFSEILRVLDLHQNPQNSE